MPIKYHNQPSSDEIAERAPVWLKHGVHFAMILVGFWLIFSTVQLDMDEHGVAVYIARAIQNIFHNLRATSGLVLIAIGAWLNIRLRIGAK